MDCRSTVNTLFTTWYISTLITWSQKIRVISYLRINSSRLFQITSIFHAYATLQNSNLGITDVFI